MLVEYALDGNTKPISVAEWDTRLTHALPEELQASLPTIEQIEAELARAPEEADAGADRDTGVKHASRDTARAKGEVMNAILTQVRRLAATLRNQEDAAVKLDAIIAANLTELRYGE